MYCRRKAVDTINEKLFGISNSLSVMRRNKEVAKSMLSYHTKENTSNGPKQNTVHNLYSRKMLRVCFVCDEPVLQKAVPLRYGLTHFSSTALPTKLGQLMGEGFMVVVADSDVLCTRCFGLLNRLDKMELEMDVVRKVLCDFLKSKYHLSQVCDGLALESLQMLDDELDATAKLGNTTRKSKFSCMEEGIYNKPVCENRHATSAHQSKLTDARKPLREVENCKETNQSQSECEEVHAKRVKFSETLIVEDEHDWSGGDDQGHVVVVHDYSDCEMMEDDDSELFTKKLVYSCVTCGYENSDKGIYEAHLRHHMNINFHKCKICLRKFATKEFLEKHAQIHKTFKCKMCDKVFMFKVDLVSHLKCHRYEDSTNNAIVVENKTAVQGIASMASEQEVIIPPNNTVTTESSTTISKSSDILTQEKQAAVPQSVSSVVEKPGTDVENSGDLLMVCEKEGSTHGSENIETFGENNLILETSFEQQLQQKNNSVKSDAESKLECCRSTNLDSLVQNNIFVDKKENYDVPKVLCAELTPNANVQPGSLLHADSVESSCSTTEVQLTEYSDTWSKGTATSSRCTPENGVSSRGYCSSLENENKSFKTTGTFAEFKNSAECLGLGAKQTHFTLVHDKSNEFALTEVVDESSTVDDIDTIARMKISELFEGNLSSDKQNETGCVGMHLEKSEFLGVNVEAGCTTES